MNGDRATGRGFVIDRAPLGNELSSNAKARTEDGPKPRTLAVLGVESAELILVALMQSASPVTKGLVLQPHILCAGAHRVRAARGLRQSRIGGTAACLQGRGILPSDGAGITLAHVNRL